MNKIYRGVKEDNTNNYDNENTIINYEKKNTYQLYNENNNSQPKKKTKTMETTVKATEMYRR